jgi:hypothetical protein
MSVFPSASQNPKDHELGSRLYFIVISFLRAEKSTLKAFMSLH